MRCYHLCPRTRRPHVLREGLVPSAPGDGGPAGVYLWLRPELVGRELHKGAARGEELEPWGVEIDPRDLHQDPELPEGHAAYVTYPVPPDRLTPLDPSALGEERAA